jgi:hypothetical protein
MMKENLMSVSGANTRAFVALSLLAAVFILPVALSANGQTRRARLSWPRKEGVYLATSSETIPAFPRALSGYRSEGGKDFWGRPFEIRGTLRVGEGNGWTEIPDFPNTQNGCSAGAFMIRWRSSSPDVLVASTKGYSRDSDLDAPKTGAFGYMYGHNCEQPLFRFAGTRNGNDSTLVDIYYELKFWQAAP